MLDARRKEHDARRRGRAGQGAKENMFTETDSIAGRAGHRSARSKMWLIHSRVPPDLPGRRGSPRQGEQHHRHHGGELRPEREQSDSLCHGAALSRRSPRRAGQSISAGDRIGQSGTLVPYTSGVARTTPA